MPMRLKIADALTPEEQGAWRCQQYHPFFDPRVPCDHQAAYACDHCDLRLCTYHLAARLF
jgi:hypothetical protein